MQFDICKLRSENDLYSGEAPLLEVGGSFVAGSFVGGVTALVG